MFDLPKKLAVSAEQAIVKKYGISTDIHFGISLEDSRGDFTTAAALSIAKTVKEKPQAVAEIMADSIRGIDGVHRVDVAGPGFVNVHLTARALTSGMESIRTACDPQERGEKHAPIIVDYSHPNIAKPIAVHHLLSTLIGQSIVNLYNHAGYTTVSINHIGDWGTQFGKLAVAFKRWGTKPIQEHSLDELLALYVRFHDEAEQVPALEDEGRDAFRRLEEGERPLRAFWSDVVKITMASMEHLYERLHVHFDYTHGESFYEDKMAPIIAEGKKKGVFRPGNGGALIAEFPDALTLPPAIVLKGAGSTIYLTRDLATARYRIDTWKPEAILYVVDVAQQMYFRQVFETLKQLQWTLPVLEHVYFGRMRFTDRKMSTRKGNILKLEEVLDEAVKRAEKLIRERGDKIQTDDPEGLAEMMGVGALVYGILSQNRKMDMVFDWKKMLSFEGNSAPYLQYTHARARSVLRKGKISDAPLVPSAELSLPERKLVKQLLLFGTTLEEARSEHLPHRLTNYLYDLCQAFNSFYNADDILTAPAEQRTFRLGLTALAARVLKTGAEIITLRVPDRM